MGCPSSLCLLILVHGTQFECFVILDCEFFFRVVLFLFLFLVESQYRLRLSFCPSKEVLCILLSGVPGLSLGWATF